MNIKRLLLIFCCLVGSLFSNAAHLKGGWIQYEYLGPGATANTSSYKITVKQYLLCSSQGGQIDQNVFLGIFNGQTNVTVSTITIPLSGTVILNNNSGNPCLTGDKNVCYRIDSYVTTVELPNNTEGYILAVQRCCRIAGIVNIDNSSNAGITYSNKIPGIVNGVIVRNNNSPVFAQGDSAIVCFNSSFTIDFGASDLDGDSLSFSFCEGQIGGNSSPTGSQPNPPTNPPFTNLTYTNPYSGSSPLGSLVSINPLTGLISGIAPGVTGDYVVAVCATEFRNGILIGITKKEIHVKVANCQSASTDLGPDEKTCDGFTFGFSNTTQAQFISYQWNFGDGTTSVQPTPTHTYTDTGKYLVRLKATATGGCQDSATKFVYVFPGFTPSITVIGSCVQQPIQFRDATTTAYGFVNSWVWNFGDLTTLADTARSKDTAWKYPTGADYVVRLTSTNSKGCEDTVSKTITVRNQPLLNLPFKDTLICSIDTLPLIANSIGTFSWTPNYNIINPNTSNPLVYPKDTTTYVVTVNDQGCISKDSITVNVLDFIRVDAGLDSAICQTDTFRLHPISQALSYIWTATTGEVVAATKYPLVRPLILTKYYVTANLGKCQDRDSVSIRPVPYPQVSASNVSPICFGGKVQLNANVVGSNFFWQPTTSLLNPTSLNPIAGPSKTTSYVITATDTIGCPKPVKDTIVVEVVPIVTVNAGRDTSIVRNQPLQLFAATGNIPPNSSFKWIPTIWLNNDTLKNPVATINSTIDIIKYKVRVTRPEGCFGEDEIVVRVFSTDPDIFMPTAFTPNNDGKNDVLKPIAVGITRLDYFRIYNRWGQLIYETRELESGWDGNFNGSPQASGTFVFVVQGVDYTGKVIFKKGTCVLIR